MSDHAHECEDIVRAGKGRHDTRWVAICTCGNKEVRMTVDSAAEAQREHARAEVLMSS